MRLLVLSLLALASAVTPATAHVDAGHTASFAAGFLHPLGGIDHLAAMLAVGMWSAMAGGERLWLWPMTFVVAMTAGGLIGWIGLPMPFVEPTIAASLVVLGVMIALAIGAPASLGALVVALFALAHGHAHGTEAAGVAFAAYGGGFVLATTLLHVAGIVVGTTASRIVGLLPLRAAGAATAVLGLVLLVRIGGSA